MTPGRSASLPIRPDPEPTPGSELSPPELHAVEPGKLLIFPAPVRVVAPEVATPSRTRLALEFLVLFVALPLALFLHLDAVLPPLALLWIAAAAGLVVLLRDPTFDRHRLWNAAPLRRQIPQVLALFAAGVVVLTVLVYQYEPALFLGLPRHHPAAWLLLMVLYPVSSVYPQSLVYRAFLFHRYRSLLESPRLMILVSALAFSFAHIVFHNWIAVALTIPGGILFARRYADTRSLAVSGLEHALYGCLLFTLGLGPFFGVHLL